MKEINMFKEVKIEYGGLFIDIAAKALTSMTHVPNGTTSISIYNLTQTDYETLLTVALKHLEREGK